MTYIIIVFIIYLVISRAESFLTQYGKDQTNAAVEALAFQFWQGSLQKTGYPRNENGSWMSHWELYEYWNQQVDKTPWQQHAYRGLKKEEKHYTPPAQDGFRPSVPYVNLGQHLKAIIEKTNAKTT